MKSVKNKSFLLVVLLFLLSSFSQQNTLKAEANDDPLQIESCILIDNEYTHSEDDNSLEQSRFNDIEVDQQACLEMKLSVEKIFLSRVSYNGYLSYVYFKLINDLYTCSFKAQKRIDITFDEQGQSHEESTEWVVSKANKEMCAFNKGEELTQ